MSLTFFANDSPELKAMENGSHLLVIGTKAQLELEAGNIPFHINMKMVGGSATQLQPGVGPPLLYKIAKKLRPGSDSPATDATYFEIDGTSVKVTLGCLPSAVASRHNAPSKPHAATDIVKGVASGEGTLRILILLASADHAVALGTAVARAFPLYSHKSSAAGVAPRKVSIFI